MNQAQIYAQGDDNNFHPCLAVQDTSTGRWILKVDTEIAVDSATMNISNIKMGSTDQTKNNLRFLKVLDDGTLVSVSVPTDLYQVSDIDDMGAIEYFGFVDVDENWYLMQKTSTSIRYVKGAGNYPATWIGRVGLTYDYFYNVF